MSSIRNDLWILRDAMKNKETGNQRAFYLLADIVLKQQKLIKELSEQIEKIKKERHPGTQIGRARKQRGLRKDGTKKENIQVATVEINGEIYPANEWR